MSYQDRGEASQVFLQLEESSGAVLNQGTGADCAVVNTLTREVTAVVGNGYNIPGNTGGSGYITTSGITGVPAFAAFSWSFMFRSSTAGTYKRIIGIEGVGDQRLFVYLSNTDELNLRVQGDNSATYNINVVGHTPSVDLNDGNWHKVVLVCDGTAFTLRIDGAAQSLSYAAQVTGGTLTLPGEIFIGASNVSGSPSISGATFDVDEIFMHFGTAWDSTAISEVEAGPLSGTPAGTTTITAPSAGAVNRDGLDMVLSYDDTDETSYRFQIATDSGFTELVETVDQVGSTLEIGYKLLDGETYYLRAAALNGSGAGTWSATVSISTETAILAATFSPSRGTAILLASQLSISDFMFVKTYLAADCAPYLTATKKYIVLKSTDHETPGSIILGEADDEFLTGYTEIGTVLTDSDISGYHSIETPWLEIDPLDARPVRLLYHAQEDASPFHQKTRMVSSAGGGRLDQISWTDDGTILETVGETVGGAQVVHTGYASKRIRENGTQVIWARYNESGGFQTARWESSDPRAMGSPVAVIDQAVSWPGVYPGAGSFPNWTGVFKYQGVYWAISRMTDHLSDRYFCINRMDADGVATGLRYRISGVALGVGDEGLNCLIDGGVYNVSDGTYQVTPDGQLIVYYTLNEPNNDNDRIFGFSVDVRQLAAVHAAGNGSTNKDTTQLVNGDFELVAVSRRTEGDRYDSVNVSVNNA